MDYKTKKTSFGFNSLYLLPLILMIALVPLIMRAYPYNSGLSSYGWSGQDEFNIDYYLYYKNHAVVLLSSLMVIQIIVEAFRKKLSRPLPKIFLCLGIFALFAILSTIFSDHSYYSIRGISEHFETIWVLLCYCIIACYAYLFLDSKERIYTFCIWLVIGIALMSVVALTQILGHNVYNQLWMQKLLFERDYWDALDGSELFRDNGIASLSLYNENYAGVYCILLLPLICFFTCSLFFQKEDRKKPLYLAGFLFCVVLSAFFAFVTYKTDSAAALIALAGMIVLAFLVLLRKIFRNKIAFFSIIGIFAIILILSIAPTPIRSKLTSLLNIQPETYALSAVTTADDYVEITYHGSTARFRIDIIDETAELHASDPDGNELSISPKEDNPFSYSLDYPGYEDVSISLLPIDGYMSIYLKIDDTSWTFSNEAEEGTYLFLNQLGKWVPAITAPSALFTGYESIATNRGYIWSRTIPLLSKHLLLGSGPDTFVFQFPQYDYVGRYNSAYTTYDIFTKPHNMYLQIAVQDGIPALIAILVFYLVYFVNGCILYSKLKLKTLSAWLGFAAFLGTAGYMITAIANDSMVAIAPVFWILMGLGYSLNHMNRKLIAEDKDMSITNKI